MAQEFHGVASDESAVGGSSMKFLSTWLRNEKLRAEANEIIRSDPQ